MSRSQVPHLRPRCRLILGRYDFVKQQMSKMEQLVQDWRKVGHDMHAQYVA